MTIMNAKMQLKQRESKSFHTCIPGYSTTVSIIWSLDGKKAHDKGVTSVKQISKETAI